MADKKKPAVKAAKIPKQNALKDLTQDKRLAIVEKYLGRSLEILANHFGGECAALKAELDAEIRESLKPVGKKR
jgi:hypothetical protein